MESCFLSFIYFAFLLIAEKSPCDMEDERRKKGKVYKSSRIMYYVCTDGIEGIYAC